MITVCIILTDFSSLQLFCLAVFQNRVFFLKRDWNKHLLTSSTFLALVILKFHSFKCFFSAWKELGRLKQSRCTLLKKDSEKNHFREHRWRTNGASVFLGGKRSKKRNGLVLLFIGMQSHNLMEQGKWMHLHWNRNVLWDEVVIDDIFYEKHFL